MRETVGMRRARPILRERAATIRKQAVVPELFSNEALDLRADDRRGRLYQAAHVCGRSYTISEAVNAFIDLESIVQYYVALAENHAIVSLVTSVPTLEQQYPELSDESISLTEADFEKKYKKLIMLAPG